MGVYISNSFQAQLNQIGQPNGGANEPPPVHFYESIHAFNPMYDLPNNPRRIVPPVEHSPRMSSESHVTCDSGIQSSVHSNERLAQASASNAASSQMPAHRPPAYSKSQEITLSALNDDDDDDDDESSVFSNSRIKHRQPSFDEVHYLSGVKMCNDKPRLLYNREEPISRSQPLDTLDYPNHKYVFSDRQASHSQSSELSQSSLSVSHLQQPKQNPEPYVEPIRLRSSLHSILGQSSQLDTMV